MNESEIIAMQNHRFFDVDFPMSRIIAALDSPTLIVFLQV